MEPKYHESVMVDEVVSALHVKKLAKYIDATLGNGGHTEAILSLGGSVLGIDLDPEMIKIARGRIGKGTKLIHGNFTDIDTIAKENGFYPADGVIFDLGVSNIHLKDLERGFSFENPEAELDMRIDPSTQGLKAKDLLNALRNDQLEELFGVTLDKGAAKWLTKRVEEFRGKKEFSKAGDMVAVCKGLKTGKAGLNEATLPFLALRIAVNSELDNLKEALPKAFDLLEEGARLIVISFHSGEDEIVKRFFEEKAGLGARIITNRPVLASDEEVGSNRRSRSAKMRVLQK